MSVPIRDLPDGCIVQRVPSPAFTIPYPDVWNAELIPDDIRKLMEGVWNTGRFSARDVTFRLIEDVFVAGEGLVFDRDLNLIRTSITQHSAAEIEKARDALLQSLAECATPALRGVLVLCKKRGIGNYGHWLLEMLPKAYLARKVLPEPKRYIVPRTTEPLAKVVNTTLALLGIAPDEIILLDDRPCRAERLIMIDGLTQHGVYISPLVLECIDALAEEIAGFGADRMYVTRHSVGYRTFLHEEVLQKFARARGYMTIDPARIPWPRQAAQFKSANRVVGVMGAAMTNVVFAPSGSTVFNLSPATMPDTFFWFICGLRGHRYTEVRCAQDGPVPRYRPMGYKPFAPARRP